VTKPLTISVIIPAFNAEKTLEFAIESALNQTYPATQIIVVDNNSTDKTVEIARKFGARILIVNCQEQGVSKARNYGVEVSTCEYIAFLDSDDAWFPEKLRKQVALIQSAKGELCIFGTYANFRIGDRKIGNSIVSSDDTLARRNFVEFGQLPCMTSSWIIEKRYYVEIGGLSGNFKMAEDFELACKLVKKGFNFRIVREPLIDYRIEEGSITHRDYIQQYLLAKYFNAHYFGSSHKEDFRDFLSRVKPFSRIWLDAHVNRFIRQSMVHFGGRKFTRSVSYLILALLINPKITFLKAKRQFKWR
jgi:glycosyltransferase involved in cell wall biosynthesis